MCCVFVVLFSEFRNYLCKVGQPQLVKRSCEIMLSVMIFHSKMMTRTEVKVWFSKEEPFLRK